VLLHDGYSRRHPNRLDSSDYRVPGQPVAIVICACEGRPVLPAHDIPSRITEALRVNAANNGVQLIAYSIMPAHLHAAAQVGCEGGDLPKFIHAFKKRTGRAIREAGIIGPIWLRSFWDRHLRPKEPLATLVRYVAWNPVEAGLCHHWQEWPYTWIDADARRYGLAGTSDPGRRRNDGPDGRPAPLPDGDATTGRTGVRPCGSGDGAMTTTTALLLPLCLAAHAQLYEPMGETVGALVRDGEPAGCIVVPAGASDHERTAATELQAYLARMSGAELPVIGEGEPTEGYPAYVGRTEFARAGGLLDRAAGLGEEGLLMHAGEDGLALLGGSDLGTYYAVYAFLEEKLGVRWFNPDPLGEVVPELPTVEVGRMDETQAPDFGMRWIGRDQWALRNRQNVGLPDESIGLKIFASAHTFRKFVPPEEHFDAHPEWFALVGGRRQRFEGHHRNQLCTSNPEVIDATVRAMRRTLDEDPDIDIITLFPNDGNGFCECEACRALDEDTKYSVEDINSGWGAADWERHRTLSRRMTIFYDECARRLAETHPDRYVKTGIYASYLLTPLDEALSVPETCIGQLCHGSCHNHPICDPDCEINRDFRASLEGWAKIYPRLCLYEYYYKVAALQLPFPIIHSMREDIPYLRDIGLFGIYTQYAQNWWTIGLSYYVAAKLLWNADLDVDALLDDYYRKMYGAAFEPMRDYWQAYEQAAIDADVHLAAEYAHLPLIFTRPLIAAQHDRLERAEALADSDAVRERVEKARIVLGYVDIAMRYMDVVMAAARAQADVRWETPGEPTPELVAAAEAVQAYLNEHDGSHCFRGTGDSYRRRFLNPANAVRRSLDVIAERTGPLTKRQWLAEQDREPRTGEPPETFAIWLYANDIDGQDGKPEHELRLLRPDGEYETVAGLVDEGARDANRANRAFVIPGLDASRFVRDGRLTLQLVNLPEDWYMSTIYAFYVMPDLEGATDEIATRLIEGDLEWVRAAAAGFHEYEFKGAANGEGEPLGQPIEVFEFPDVSLPH